MRYTWTNFACMMISTLTIALMPVSLAGNFILYLVSTPMLVSYVGVGKEIFLFSHQRFFTFIFSSLTSFTFKFVFIMASLTPKESKIDCSKVYVKKSSFSNDDTGDFDGAFAAVPIKAGKEIQSEFCFREESSPFQFHENEFLR